MSDEEAVAPKPDLGVSTEVVQTLMEVGYVAVGRGLRSHAEAIFRGVAAARPGSDLPLVGLGVCRLNFGDYKGASEVLMKEALKINPDSGLAKAFLAIVLKEMNMKAEAETLMETVKSTSTDPAAVNLATSYLTGKDVGEEQ